jgi:hypothetical protein
MAPLVMIAAMELRGTGKDDSLAGATRLLRLPGSTHRKVGQLTAGERVTTTPSWEV